MKLNVAERALVNNPIRVLVQRLYEVPLLQQLGGRVENGRVLEVGCGRGAALPLLLTSFGAASVDGVDLDPEQIARAEKRLRRSDSNRIHLHVAAAERLPFMNATFDAVFDFGSLHHVPAWQTAVAEMSRVLKPGGALFFEEVTRAALERWIYRTLLRHPKDNRFSETDFLDALRHHHLQPDPRIHRLLFDDIFIGVAKRS